MRRLYMAPLVLLSPEIGLFTCSLASAAVVITQIKEGFGEFVFVDARTATAFTSGVIFDSLLSPVTLNIQSVHDTHSDCFVSVRGGRTAIH